MIAPAYAYECANTVFSGEFETGYQLQWQEKSEENWQRQEDTPVSTMSLALESCLSAETRLNTEFTVETGEDRDTGFDSLYIETAIKRVDLMIGKIESITYSSDSIFSSPAATEFSEADGKGLSLAGGFDSADSESGYRLYLIQGNHDASHSGNREYSYGITVSFASANRDLALAVGALSDLWTDGSDIASASAPLGFGQLRTAHRKWFFLLEHAAVSASFENAEPESARPRASLMEIGREFSDKSTVSLRMESSRQLPEEPERRIGLSFQYEASQQLGFTVEYLHSYFSQSPESVYEKKQESLILFVGRITF